MIKIHDIKPIVEIPDVSIYIYYSLIIIFILLLCIGIYFIYKFLKPKVKSHDLIWYEKLKNVDFTKSKDAAYKISKYGRLLAKDERQLHLVNELIEELSLYKYKKMIPNKFSKETKIKFNIFMDSLDVR